ncbi:MAG: hypothetical protein JWM14_2643 [Chitinophagaceae bacterium]|nr:hypothetical protein [Chitinophagaceae bacterium]
MFLKNLNLIHGLFAVLLALFFIYAGAKKFIPKPPRSEDKIALVEAVSSGVYAPPVAFKLTMKSMSQTGFLKMVGVFQILAGLLMLIPQTRLTGLLLLLPVILNIFTLHLFLDNRPDENIETGLCLALTVVLIAFYYQKIVTLVWIKKNQPSF